MIGSGPAGLTAAGDLRTKGYQATVFEALPVAGGMMRVGMPSFRLPPERLDWDIQNIGDGIEIKTDSRVESIDRLFREGYGAVFIATGTHIGKKLPILGADLPQVLIGTEFLRAAALDGKAGLGERVLVLGGGNVAIDVARTAARLGAKSVRVACLESLEKIPADPWEIEDAEREDITIHPSRSSLEIVSKNGGIAGVR